MSGTSLDGLDLAYCHFWKDNRKWDFEIKRAKTIAYDHSWNNRLEEAFLCSATELLRLDQEYGHYLGQQAQAFIRDEGINVDFISSHGHTVHHQPHLGFTFQIGAGQQLAISSGQVTVCDFRTKDIALGGQGAPLVPIGDQIFFGNYNFCLNLGGISNVSMEKDGKRIAYDIGVANMLLNHLSQKIGLAYDDGGTMARRGRLNEKLLNRLNALEYYKLNYPKSTGYEWFKGDVLPIIEQSGLEVQDLLHTSVHHICEQITSQLLIHTKANHHRVLITGGGAFNKFLIEMLENKLESKIEVVIPIPDLISYKEALVFAFMGLLRTENEINVLSSVTGAKQDSSSGIVFHPS